jgi:D-tyrosyl-tRNA(Tyr) deacylase
MRALVQRVLQASVTIDGEMAGQIGPGLLVLLGVRTGDTPAELDWMVNKVAGLRIFADAEGKMNRSVKETGGAVLVVSQFTLYGDARKGFRPGFTEAARPEISEPMYERFVEQLRSQGLTLATGRFGADMQVALVNDGPVTIMLEKEASENAGGSGLG